MPHEVWTSLAVQQIGELSKLRQTGTVQEYQRQFEQLSARASSLTGEQEVSFFISGLQEQIAIEWRFNVRETSPLPRAWPDSMKGCGILQAEPKHTMNNLPVARPSHMKQLSCLDMEERRSRGLCLNCDELFAPGHKCKRLFSLEMVGANALDDKNSYKNLDDLGISLYVITGLLMATQCR